MYNISKGKVYVIYFYVIKWWMGNVIINESSFCHMYQYATIIEDRQKDVNQYDRWNQHRMTEFLVQK